VHPDLTCKGQCLHQSPHPLAGSMARNASLSVRTKGV
jgi:hypothetical protein